MLPQKYFESSILDIDRELAAWKGILDRFMQCLI